MQGKDFKEKECMSFDGFCACIRMDIQRRLGNSFHVSVEDVTKNNDTKMKGLIIREQGTNIYPTIYMECFYDSYRKGVPLMEIEGTILQIYQENKTEKRFDSACFTEWKRVKERVTYKLVSFDRNRELLKDIPHRKFLDLAIVYECFLGMKDDGGASIRINNRHLNLWKVTADELHETAFINTPRLMGYRFSNMKEVLTGLMGCGKKDMLDGLLGVEDTQDGRPPLYVLTNRYNVHGAGCILYKNLLKNISEKWGCDICIIPSSVHETILLPMNEEERYGEMSQIVCEVNKAQVMPDEVLSDHVYQFVRKTGKIVM